MPSAISGHVFPACDPSIKADALKQPGCKPMKGYVFIHPEGLEHEAQLAHWVKLAFNVNPRAAASKKRRE